MSTRVIGNPGSYAARQAASNRARAFIWRAAAAAGAVAALLVAYNTLTHLDGGYHAGRWVLTLAAGVFAVFAHFRAAPFALSAGRQMRGVEAEREVLGALRKAGVELVINGAELRAGGDADHVVAFLRGNRTGSLAVIETKAGGGEVQIKGGALLSGRQSRRIPGDPVRQVQRQVDGLERLTGRRALGIVCIPGMTNGAFLSGRVVVCGKRDLAQALASAPLVSLTDSDVNRFAEGIRVKP